MRNLSSKLQPNLGAHGPVNEEELRRIDKQDVESQQRARQAHQRYVDAHTAAALKGKKE